MKSLIGAIAVALTIVAYVPYIRDIIRGKTKPHVYSWFMWGFVTAIAFALQTSGHAGPGSFVTLAAAALSFVVFAFGMRDGKKDITTSDTVFFILALVAVVIWLFAKQPVVSVILISAIDMLGFVPTIRKSWNKPYTETLSLYTVNTFRFGLSIIALQHYTIVTALYPVTWILANGGFSLLLMMRRRQLRH